MKTPLFTVPTPESFPAYKSVKAWLDNAAKQLNQLTEGYIVSVTNRQASVPTSGDFSPGDFVKNSNRSELGAPGSKYILDGWECATSDPLVFLERHFLTGN